ncbi:MAG: hypothetical protein KF891_23525 [Rhizobacter sp.]|nr:hypothetical protein [Rhizobacter sp.]
MKHTSALLSLFAATAVLAGCASKSPAPASSPAPAAAPAAAPAPAGQMVKSRDGKYEGEVIGKARAGSKFSRLQIGMQMSEVQTIMGSAPDRFHTYESGKRWIPFYFGNDARRMQALYKGEGCLTFTGGNVWGSSGGDLVGIHHDATGACYTE